jgi:phosphotriesterase-related protein
VAWTNSASLAKRASTSHAWHAGKLVLSHDYSCFIDWFPEQDLSVRFPNWHYLHIHQDVIPALRRLGVSEDEIRTMLIDNPRRIFERTGGY